MKTFTVFYAVLCCSFISCGNTPGSSQELTTSVVDTEKVTELEPTTVTTPSPSLAKFFSDLGTVSGQRSWGLGNIAWSSPQILKVNYPKGSVTNSLAEEGKTPSGGCGFYVFLPKPTDSLHLKYSLRFAENFDFVKGGKLPGLFSGTATGGGNIPDGTNGFSTRFMWRKNGDGEIYAYLPTSTEIGTSIGRGNWKFEKGKWYVIEQKITLNTIGQTDGRIQVWLDRKLVLDVGNILFRTVDTVKIEGIMFSTFFGGSDSSWATPVDTSIEFTDFSVVP